MVTQELETRIGEGVLSLTEEFRGIYGPETIRRCALETVVDFREARIVEFVPLLVYRETREKLRTFAQTEGKLTKPVPELLFVCVHNAGRSQMAAALTAAIGGERVHVRSAGSSPGEEINTVAVEAMNEIGLDLSHEFPKPLTDEAVQAADMVITMGCGDACPIYPGKRYMDWEIDDPAGKPIKDVRRIRDEIRDRVERLLRDLGVPTVQS
jgi:protein-tyrosine-phosphatase